MKHAADDCKDRESMLSAIGLKKSQRENMDMDIHGQKHQYYFENESCVTADEFYREQTDSGAMWWKSELENDIYCRKVYKEKLKTKSFFVVRHKAEYVKKVVDDIKEDDDDDNSAEQSVSFKKELMKSFKLFVEKTCNGKEFQKNPVQILKVWAKMQERFLVIPPSSISLRWRCQHTMGFFDSQSTYKDMVWEHGGLIRCIQCLVCTVYTQLNVHLPCI